MFFILLLASLAALIAYLVTHRRRRRTRIVIAGAIFLGLLGAVTALLFLIGDRPSPDAVTVREMGTTGTDQRGSLPAWVAALIEGQPLDSRLVIEEADYQGRRAFLVMPPDRGFDTANEHVLRSEDGRIICEFGGFAGHVTQGACDINGIKYVRTVFGKQGS